ncbi:AAA family ATPase [Saccharothrix isguenensis]
MELPVHPSAGTFVPDDEPTVAVGRLLAGLGVAGPAASDGGIAAELLARLALEDAGMSTVGRAELLGAASREAERLGDIAVRPEHLVLGWLRVVEDGSDPGGAGVDRAREELQLLMADRAHAQYEELQPIPRPDAVRRPRTVLLAGVPGVGKSTLAEALAWRLTAPVFSMDWQLGALVPFGALRSDNTLPLAELNLTASIARQVRSGLDVIVDATGHRAETRRRWRSVTENLGGVFVGVECVCSDERVQRGRVEGRERGIPGWHATVSWDHVLRMKERWEAWDEPHLVVDSAVESPESALRKVLDATDIAGRSA